MKKLMTLALAAGALAATLGSAPAPSAVTLLATNLSFSEMRSACSDALGGVTFSSGHVRFISSENVGSSSDSAGTGIESITFSGAHGSANAVANGHDRSVTAKRLQVRSRRTIACIFPD